MLQARRLLLTPQLPSSPSLSSSPPPPMTTTTRKSSLNWCSSLLECHSRWFCSQLTPLVSVLWHAEPSCGAVTRYPANELVKPGFSLPFFCPLLSSVSWKEVLDRKLWWNVWHYQASFCIHISRKWFLPASIFVNGCMAKLLVLCTKCVEAFWNTCAKMPGIFI